MRPRATNNVSDGLRAGAREHARPANRHHPNRHRAPLSTLDEHGHELRSEEDSDADGKVDNISTYEWNECDNLAKYETDQGADGTVDYSGSYSWDDQAMVMTERYSGMTTAVTRHIYENGVLLREETDDGGNGSVDSMLVHIYGSECLLP